MLVREVLTGVAEALALDGSDLIDIHTAVTEACNNVVQHAYEEDEGPLGVMVKLARTAITVAVRDWGRGIPLHVGAAPEAGPGIGLPVIRALAHRLELRRPAEGGTEVWMEFATQGAHDSPKPLSVRETALPVTAHAVHEAALPAIAHTEHEAVLPAIAHTEHAPTIALTIVPADLARAVLPRLMCGLAARAHFSTDRLSDVHLLADALGASGAAPLRIDASVEPRALELHIGPLERGQAQGLITASSLGGLGSVIAKLVDRHHVESAGSYEVLALRLADHRRGRARDAGSARR